MPEIEIPLPQRELSNDEKKELRKQKAHRHWIELQKKWRDSDNARVAAVFLVMGLVLGVIIGQGNSIIKCL